MLAPSTIGDPSLVNRSQKFIDFDDIESTCCKPGLYEHQSCLV